MLIIGDKQVTGGSFDFSCILYDVRHGRFHPCVMAEKPMPGPLAAPQDATCIRVMSKGHHTEGFETFEEAVTFIQTQDNLVLVESNCAVKHALQWDSDYPAIVWIMPNWHKESEPNLDEALAGVATPFVEEPINV